MKVLKPIFILLAGLTILSCGPDEVAMLANMVEDVRMEYAPDKRLDVYDINFSPRNEGYLIDGHTTQPLVIEGLKAKLDSLSIAYEMAVEIIPNTSDTLDDYGLINISVANMRDWHRHSNQLVTQVLMGHPIKIIERYNSSWYRIQSPDGYLGWIDRDAFQIINEQELKNWQNAQRAVVTTPYSWIVDDSSNAVSDVVYGCILEVLGEDDSKLHVKLPDGRSGYLEKSATVSIESWLNQGNPTSSEILASAKQYLGVPYLWGGTSSKGFDCSGFTKTIFESHGIAMLRDASQQIRLGEVIEKDTTFKSLLPGDLLYFGSLRRDGTERITHVAIHMGNGKIIHATGRVKIESLNKADEDFNQYRYDTWMHVRRMLDSNNSSISRVNDRQIYTSPTTR